MRKFLLLIQGFTLAMLNSVNILIFIYLF